MIRYESDCAACDALDIKPSCDGCSNKNIPHYFCDECKEEVEELYEDTDETKQLCADCILKKYRKILDFTR